MGKIILGVVNFGKWLWGIIRLPFIFDECVKLLKEVNAKLESPSQYNERLQWIEKIHSYEIQELTKERDRLSVGDSEKRAQIEDLISKSERSKTEVQELLKENKKISEQMNTFLKAFEASERVREILSEELRRSKFIPPLPPLFASAFLAGRETLLDREMKSRALAAILQRIDSDKKQV